MNLRRRVKGALERAVLVSGVPAAVRLRRRRDALVLAYHNIVPEGEAPGGDASLHLPRRVFAEHLDTLRATHDVVPLAAVLGAPRAPGRRPRAAITFDDGYRGALTAGIAELAARALPATIFVAPAYVGGVPFWWDRLATAGIGGVAPAVRSRALAELHGRDEEIIHWAQEKRVPLRNPPAHACGASLEELEEAIRHPGVTLASHSWSHPNLGSLEGAELSAELRRPLEWLGARFANVMLPVLSYPYGLSSPVVERAAAAAGYRAALRIDGGWVPREVSNPYALPRLNVPAGLSPAGLALRAAGLLC